MESRPNGGSFSFQPYSLPLPSQSAYQLYLKSNPVSSFLRCTPEVSLLHTWVICEVYLGQIHRDINTGLKTLNDEINVYGDMWLNIFINKKVMPVYAMRILLYSPSDFSFIYQVLFCTRHVLYPYIFILIPLYNGIHVAHVTGILLVVLLIADTGTAIETPHIIILS